MRLWRGPAGFDALLACAVALLLAAGSLGLALGRFQVPLSPALPALGGCALLGLLRIFYERRDPKLRALLSVALWAIALSNAYLLPMYALARLGGPLRDDLLAAADRALGLDIPALVRWTRSRPWATQTAQFAYDSLQPMCLLTLVVSTLAGQEKRARQGVLALAIASFLTLAAHGLAPAAGPWTSGLAPPTPDQAATSEAYRLLRSASPFVVDLSRPDPLVAFPSWHALLAALCAAVLASVRPLAPLAALWGAGIILSTLFTGWHYGVDVLGALATAAIAYHGAARVAGRLAQADGDAPG